MDFQEFRQTSVGSLLLNDILLLLMVNGLKT